MNITRAVYRPAYQDITIYSDDHPEGYTSTWHDKREVLNYLRLVGFEGKLEEDSGATVYGLLKSTGKYGT